MFTHLALELPELNGQFFMRWEYLPQPDVISGEGDFRGHVPIYSVRDNMKKGSSQTVIILGDET